MCYDQFIIGPHLQAFDIFQPGSGKLCHVYWLKTQTYSVLLLSWNYIYINIANNFKQFFKTTCLHGDLYNTEFVVYLQKYQIQNIQNYSVLNVFPYINFLLDIPGSVIPPRENIHEML